MRRTPALLGAILLACGRPEPARDTPAVVAESAIAVAPVTPSDPVYVPPQMSDSAFREHVTGLGLLVPFTAEDRDTAYFYFVDVRDTGRSMRDLGFFPAAALLDTASRFQAHGDSAAAAAFAISDVQPPDSALRVLVDGCIAGVPAPLRPAMRARWRLGLAPGAASLVPLAEWATSGLSRADTAAAIALGERLPLAPDDSTFPALQRDTTLARIPHTVRRLHRFALDDVVLLLVELQRERRSIANGATAAPFELVEQRLLLAERQAHDTSSPWRIAWSHYDLSSSDEGTTLDPILLLRMGPSRLPTLYLDADYEDGAGGVFVARTGDGRWEEIASWYGGC